MNTQNTLLAVTGASGSVYAQNFIRKIGNSTSQATDSAQGTIKLYVIFTETAKEVFLHETGCSYADFSRTVSTGNPNIHFISNTDFHFKYASGSHRLDCMVVLPCSMGTLGRIAQGLSLDLIGRIADVQLKERRKLILVPREAPYNLLHLRNMTALTEAGAIITPASPSFYARPQTLEELTDSFTERILELSGINPLSEKYRW